MSGVLLDSTVVIDLLRGHRAALDYVLSLGTVPAASEITRVEVLRGVRSGERRLTERLLGTFRWLPLDEAVARRAGDLGRRWRASHRGLATADLVIAATALEHELDLATLNVRHFPMFEGSRRRTPRDEIAPQVVYSSRSIPGMPSKPRSKLITRSMSRACMTATWIASRADRVGSEWRIRRARSTSLCSIG